MLCSSDCGEDCVVSAVVRSHVAFRTDKMSHAAICIDSDEGIQPPRTQPMITDHHH